MIEVNYVNHSGGANGSDSYWDQIGKEFGVTDHRHYWHATRTPAGNVELTDEQIEEAWPHVLRANRTLKRYKPERFKSLLARNYYQVLNADAIYAIGQLDRKIVQGGTGWAVQMAIDCGKPVFLFDQYQNKWKKLSRKQNTGLVPNGYHTHVEDTTCPTLTPHFAGIGSRKITPQGIQAIRDVYQNTFKS